jgi:hypothetical protein
MRADKSGMLKSFSALNTETIDAYRPQGNQVQTGQRPALTRPAIPINSKASSRVTGLFAVQTIEGPAGLLASSKGWGKGNMKD